MGSPGFVVWFTGLSGAGKSTLATRLAAELRARGEHVELLDGDEVRTHLSKGLGFSRADRDTNVLRIGFVARLLARAGACAITAAISPYRAARDEVRAGTERFLEVWCRAPLDALAARDPKGLYQKAMRGEISGFTGVDDPYEEPAAAEVECETASEDVETSLLRVLDALADRGWIGRSLSTTSPRAEPGGLEAVPHGGALEERVVSATRREELAVEARALVSLPVSEASEDLLDAFATGLLSPLRGFPTEREDHAIERERRLERGIPWPSRLLLTAAGEHPAAGAARGTSVALVGREVGAKAILDVSETFSLAPGSVAMAGELTVLRVSDGLASASAVRAALVAAGHRRVAGLVARTPQLDPAVVRAALLLADALLVATVDHDADLDALDLPPESRRRIFVVRIARLPARGPRDAILEAIALKNLGVSCAVLDPAAFAGPGELQAERSLRAHLAAWPRAGLGIDVVVLGAAERDARLALEALSPLALPPGLLDEVAAAHRTGRRAYHDLGHVADVARALGETHTRLGSVTPPESFLAALFHDAVYDAGRPDNEQRSAALARAAIGRWLPDLPVDAARVVRLVELTARHGRIAPSEIDAFEAAFLDADMAILGAAPAVFDRYDEAVAWEYAAAVPRDAWLKGRRRFLEGLLAAPRIFLGDDAHARLDAPARENLRRALAAVS